jgi:hypothetical protein
MQAPRPAALHWSRVEPGQAFTLTLEYDSEIYEGALEREVRLRRNAETGFSESDDPLWRFTASKFTDSEHHAASSARAHYPPPPKKQQKKQRTDGPMLNFFARGMHTGGEFSNRPKPVYCSQ